MSKPYEQKTYYALALDPIHVGTGGYRLGKVDMSIIREPGTNLPKVPGTSLSGVVRTYTALAKDKYRWSVGIDPSQQFCCAGKGGDFGEKHCGERNCPVCVTYGFSKGVTGSSFQGLAQFSDARILFFPVHSMKGPVWVTCPSVMRDFSKALTGNEDSIPNCKLNDNDEALQTDLKGVAQGTHLNLGWLLLTNEIKASPTKETIPELNEEIQKRLVLVSDGLFSHVVNDNLEVRTSVAIDPATGAAEEHALYCYEAIPRATVLWWDVVFNKPEYFRVKVLKNNKPEEKEIDDGGRGCQWVRDNVETGLKLLAFLGVGGMGTRGMGRLRVLNLENNEQSQEQPSPRR